MKNERCELNDKEMENVSGGTDNNYAYPTIVACKGPDGWDDPKYILGAGGIPGGMQMSTEAKPVECPEN